MENKSINTKKKLQPHPLHPGLLYNPDMDNYPDQPPSKKTLESIELLKKVGLPKEYYEENGPVVNWKY
jgi:hypothetical protein